MPSGAEQAAAAARAAKRSTGHPAGASKQPSRLGTFLALLSIYSALKRGDFTLSKYSKFFGTIIGSVVGVGLSYAASRGLATCSIVDGTETCSLWGMSQAQITGFLVMVIGSAGTWVAPPNSPLIK